MNINMSPMNFHSFGNANQSQGTMKYADYASVVGASRKASTMPVNANKKNDSLVRMLSRSTDADANKKQQGTFGIIQDSINYANSLNTERTKKSSTASELKKLQYDFKGISSQIIRSKTSLNAKQVAGKARREVIRLQREKASGQYDDEELQLAITHAKAMERVAKKKALHLQEEELVKVTGGPCEAETEEKREEIEEKRALGASAEKNNEDLEPMGTDEYRQMMEERMAEYEEMMQEEMEEELQDAMAEMMEEELSEMMDDMEEEMKKMMEESALSDLLEEMEGAVEQEMDPEDFKMMKIKHRTEEMKAIAKADAEFLKSNFERLERQKAMAVVGAGLASGKGSMPMGTGTGVVISAGIGANSNFAMTMSSDMGSVSGMDMSPGFGSMSAGTVGMSPSVSFDMSV